MDRSANWGSILLLFCYVWWGTLNWTQDFPDVGDPGSLENLALTAFLAFGFCLLGYGFLIVFIEYPRSVEIEHGKTPSTPSFMRFQKEAFQSIFPLLPATLLPLGLLMVSAVESEKYMSLIRPEMMLFFTSVGIGAVLSNLYHFTESDTPLLDSLSGGWVLTLLGFMLLKGLPVMLRAGPPFSWNTLLIITVLTAVLVFTLSPVLTGNAYLDSMLYSLLAVVLSSVLYLGALELPHLQNPLQTAKVLLISSLICTFCLRLWLYGRSGK